MLKSCMNKKGRKAKTRCICGNIKESIKDENMAGYKDYPQLSNQMKAIGWKNESRGIRKMAGDERGHKRELRKIYKKRC